MNPKRWPDVNDAHRYAFDVLEERIRACQYVKLACQRYFDDLQTGHQRGLRLNPERADRVLKFFQLTRHVKGKFAKTSQGIRPEPWFAFCLLNVYGWERVKSERRRFRYAYLEVGRKNGKSTNAAGLALYSLVADNEPGAEVYSAAVTRDQAKIVWAVAKEMVKRSPLLKERIEVLANNLNVQRTASLFMPLSSDQHSLEGLNTHTAIIDELHAHKKREVFDVIDSSTGAREQPLIWVITTAGNNRMGICYEQRSYLIKVLEDTLQDDTVFGMIYTLDEADYEHWTDPRLWIKANPNLGVSVSLEDLERQAVKAAALPTAQANFLTKRLNVWVSAYSTWMNMLKWNQAPARREWESLKGQRCYIGVDLSSKIDLTAVVAVFPDEFADSYDVFCWFFLPEDTLEETEGDIAKHYRTWTKDGVLTTTDGASVDYDAVEAVILMLHDTFEVAMVGSDPWNARATVGRLEKQDVNIAEVPMNVHQLSEPMKQLQADVLSGRCRHGGNPALTWMVSNVVCKEDANRNIFPRKEKTEDKIDGAVALIIARGQMLRIEGDEDGGGSVYDEREMVFL